MFNSKLKEDITYLKLHVQNLKKRISLLENPYIYNIGDRLSLDIEFYFNINTKIKISDTLIIDRDYHTDYGIYYKFINLKNDEKFIVYQDHLTGNNGKVKKLN